MLILFSVLFWRFTGSCTCIEFYGYYEIDVFSSVSFREIFLDCAGKINES